MSATLEPGLLMRLHWIGTHPTVISDNYLQAHLDEFEFRHDRRNIVGVGRIAVRFRSQR
jgi:hypothetical protein